VTLVPLPYVAEQVVPQVMPAGAEVTLPVPLTTTLSVRGIAVNVAWTVVAAVTATEHVPVPVQPPLPLRA